jgi:hypothetical protein
MLVPRRGSRALRSWIALPGLLLAFACGGGGGGGTPIDPTPKDLASVTPSPQQAARSDDVGAFAADYLRSTNFDRILVEVDHPDDWEPEPDAIALLAQRLSERCDKPGGVDVVVDEGYPPEEGRPIWSPNDQEEFEDAHRQAFADLPSKTVAMYVLYVHGHSVQDGQLGTIIGQSYRAGSFVYFLDRARENANPPQVLVSELEGTTIVHESGHLLGLVDGRVPMVHNHEDGTHGYHDVDPDCVMYFLVHANSAGPSIGDPDFAQFDPECVADLEAFGGLGPLPKPAVVGPPRPAWAPWFAGGSCGTPHGAATPR